MTEIAMLHDTSKCTACRACMVACKQWKNLPAVKEPFYGTYQSHKGLNPNTYNVMLFKEVHIRDEFKWIFLKHQCFHCGQPGCAAACPKGALIKNANGPVTYDLDKCIGCRYCESGCPFGVPKVDMEREKVTKCDLCFDRIENGMVPSCAQTCTANAIIFGAREEMTALAKTRLEELKKDYPDACLYGVDKNDGVGGTSMMYILYEKPSVFDLPENPSLSSSLGFWKNIIQPGGKILIGAAAVAIAGACVANAIKAAKKGEDHENKQD